MKGKRIFPSEDGIVSSSLMSVPGSYGKTIKLYSGRETSQNWWQVTAPDGSGCVLNPNVHSVTENADGTITVYPSIVTESWHGWLQYGIWRSV